MPTYEYTCPKCGIVEAFQSMKDAPLTRCPQCKKTKVTRLISGGSGVIFTGSGFWETDYNRSADYKKQSGKPETKSDGTKSDKPTEPSTKPEPKAAPATAAKPAAKPDGKKPG